MAMLGAGSVHAQNFANDARLIGMGGLGGQKTDAVNLAGKDRSYSAIALPAGLLQTMSNLSVFNPKEKASFNLIKAVDYASNPNQFILDRDGSDAASRLASDLLRANVLRDFTRYRGFNPQDIDTGGIISPKWGKIFKVREDGDEFHGLFLGIGPYVSLQTNVKFDPRLRAIFSDPSVSVNADDAYWIGRDRTDPATACIPGECTPTFAIQSAAALTAGYRARFNVPASMMKLAGDGGSDRDGIYVAFNVSYLRGIRYEDTELTVLIETDSSALVETFPTIRPLTLDRLWSGRAAGRSVDFSIATVMDRLSLNFGAEGIGNQLNWRDLKSKTYELANITNSSSFIRTSFVPNSTNKQVKLPVRYTAGGSYKFDNLALAAQFRHGLQKGEFNAGAEYPWWFMEFRGGMRYTSKVWNPTLGLGLNMGNKAGFDIAAYTNSGNLERIRKTAFAVSFRVNHS
jgi:hypothetical protein